MINGRICGKDGEYKYYYAFDPIFCNSARLTHSRGFRFKKSCFLLEKKACAAALTVCRFLPENRYITIKRMKEEEW